MISSKFAQRFAENLAEMAGDRPDGVSPSCPEDVVYVMLESASRAMYAFAKTLEQEEKTAKARRHIDEFDSE